MSSSFLIFTIPFINLNDALADGINAITSWILIPNLVSIPSIASLTEVLASSISVIIPFLIPIDLVEDVANKLILLLMSSSLFDYRNHVRKKYKKD